jgi:tetratricopeptide (TPR) repeat protein
MVLSKRLLLSATAITIVATSLTGCSRNNAEAVRAYIARGDADMAKGKTSEAIIEYKNAAQRDPRQGQLRNKLAEAYTSVGDAPNAFREVMAAAELLPNDVGAQFRAAVLNLAARRYDDARAYADKALALDPTNIDARVARGNALAGLKDLNAAVSEMQQAIKLDPERALTYLNLAGVQQAQGNPQKAEDTFKQAVALAPKSVEARLALGNFYASTGRRDLAENAIKGALALDPKNLQANGALAYLYIASGRAADAEAPLKLVVDSGKDQSAALLLAARYRATGRTPLALALYDRLASDPSIAAVALSQRAGALFEGNRKAEAYATVQSVLNKSPSNSVALLTKAVFLKTDRDLVQAEKLAKSATTSDPSSVGAEFELGRIQGDLGELDEAAHSYNEALRLAPRFLLARIELARVDLLQDRPADALQNTSAVLAAQPHNAAAMLLQAQAYLEQGKPDAADPPLRALASSFPDAADVQVSLGGLFLLRNNHAAARSAYERALKTDPTNAKALVGLLVLDSGDRTAQNARARIDAALAHYPATSPLMVVAARTYGSTGDQAQAEHFLRRAIDLDPNNLEALVLLGGVLSSEHRLDEAVAEFKSAADRRPTSVGPPTQVGMFLEMENRRADAVSWYERALGIDKHAAVAANNLAMFYADTGGNLDTALALAQTAKSQLPDAPEVSDTLGWIYYKKGLAALAVGPLEECVAKDPGNRGYVAHLGLAYAKGGQPDKARKFLQEALAHGNNFAEGREVQDALAGLSGR